MGRRRQEAKARAETARVAAVAAAEEASKKAGHRDALMVCGRDGTDTTVLHNLLAGRPSFLICGGPSTKLLNMAQLKQRGIFTLAINNMAGHFHANAFTFSDPPGKFHDAIWLDPTVMKFVPRPKLTDAYRGLLRTKRGGTFQELVLDGRAVRTPDCPNVWGYAREAWWTYDDKFFTEPFAHWGNNNDGVNRTGNPKVLCSMLLVLRLLYYLGSRVIFLVGVDFTMTTDAGYSFGQIRNSGAVNCNSGIYQVVNDGLCKMAEAGVFSRAGVEVYNCNKLSGLRAFPYAPFDTAIDETLKGFPRSVDLAGWYDKAESAKEKDDGEVELRHVAASVPEGTSSSNAQ